MKQQNSLIVIALLIAAGSTTLKTSAQTAADNFPLPASIAAGTKVQIDGSSSLQVVNQGLKDRFQKQFPNADVTIPKQYLGSDRGVKAIAEDKADLAGVGRLLTQAEKAQGLAAKSIGRAKIAIIVKDDNPYTGNLTLTDFAKIYRGEVTDWSQLPSANGAKGKITVIDRPDTSDTRRAFANYPVFQNGKLKTGSNAQKLTEDSTSAVVAKLGKDGIGYAPADQIKNIPGIRAITLHSTQPDNPKYPFSQPLAYVYKNKDGKVRDGAKAFLGYVSDPAGQLAIKESVAVSTVAAGAIPNPTASTSPVITTTTTETTETSSTTGAVSPSPTTTTETTTNTTKIDDRGGFNPLWLLLLPVAGGLLWLLRKKPTPAPTPIATAPETIPTIKPLYPPPPSRTSKVDGLSGDLSVDLSSNLGSYRPSGDLRSGDLRSGDLSGTLPLRPLDIPNTNIPPNINFNGVVDPVKTNASDINLAGGAAIVGGTAAAAALGKGIFDSTQETFGNRGEDRSGELHPPEIKAPDIDLSNPLEGLKDKSSNLMPNLDPILPLEGSMGSGDSIQDRGNAIADDAAELFDDRDNLLSADLSLEEPNLDFRNPLSGIPAQTTESLPVDLNPADTKTIDLVDFLTNGGGATLAAGGASSGGAALFGGAGKSVSEFLSGKEDPVSAAPEDEINHDPFDFGNLLDPVENKATEFQDNSIELLSNDIDNDPFDFGNTLDLQDQAINPMPDEIDFNLDDLFGDLTDNNPSNFFTTGSAAIGTAGAGAIAGGAALFGGEKPQPEVVRPNPEIDTFDRDLEAINLDDLDEDPFAGLSDLLGEETGDIAKETPQPEPNDFFANLKDKASDLVEDGKELGGAALAGGAAATFGAGKAVQSFFAGKETPTGSADNPTDRRNDLSGNLYSDGQITLVASSTTQAYAHWEIPVSLKRQLREQGGQRLVVRLYDVTNADVNIELPTIFQEFECSDSAWDLELPISQIEHRYLTEIGYGTEDGRWLMLARSAPLWIRANNS
ncbi:MAG: substrate-binding domain-containing protein [Chamaesiphon sp.]|nr:substrate-binding domain-containing protein [Chamaesiphon sp.]